MAKSLAQIANKIKSLAVAKAPKKTGNLKRQLDTYNRPSGMIKESKTDKSRSFEFTLDVSPPGAEYGKFWNDPTVSDTVRRGKTKNVPGAINFAQKAIDDPSIEKMIDEYLLSITDEFVTQIKKGIDDLDK
jgi:hypothetical protein